MLGSASSGGHSKKMSLVAGAKKRVLLMSWIMSLRYHPDCGSSNPAAQSLFRCNVDIQCTDRVYVLVLKQKRRRWRRKLVVSASQEQDGGAVDSGSRVGDLEEDLSLPAAAAGSSTLHNEGMPGDDSAVAGGGADFCCLPVW